MFLYLKHSARRAVGTLLLCGLLACAVALGCIGMAAQRTTAAQLAQLEASHTTLALVNGVEESNRYGSYSSDGTISWAEGDGPKGSPSAAKLFFAAKDAPQVLRRATAGILTGYLPEGTGLCSASENPDRYNVDMDILTAAHCVLAVRCTAIRDVSTPAGLNGRSVGGSPIATAGWARYIADLEVLAAPVIQDAFAGIVGTTIQLREWDAPYYTPDLRIPFEVGKTYLVRGVYHDSTRTRFVDGGDIAYLGTDEYALYPGFSFFQSNSQGTDSLKKLGFVASSHVDESWYTTGQSPEDAGITRHEYLAWTPEQWASWDDWYNYTMFPPSAYPFITQYTGSLEDFLASPDGKVWREELIPLLDMQLDSVQLVLTEDVMTTYNFNTGAATVLEGRLITDEEYAAGADVCLVSAMLARANGWQLGDTVQVDCYKTGMTAKQINNFQMQLGQKNRELIYGQSWLRHMVTPADSIGLSKAYTIVGIYTAPEYSIGLQNFFADTVFVPKASVPNAEKYENTEVNYANALVLQNGTETEFEAYMAEKGMGGQFTYCDQNYAAVHSAYTAMAATANRLVFIGLGVLVIAAAAYHLLFLRRLAPTVRSARLIGVSAARVGQQLAGTLLLHTLLSVAAGAGMAVALYGTVTETLLGQLAMDGPAILRTAAWLLGALAVTGIAVALPCAHPSLMRRARGGQQKHKATASAAAPVVNTQSTAPARQAAIATDAAAPAAAPAFAVASVFTGGLQSMTLRGLARRRTTALVLAALALVGVLGAALLLWQIDRQQARWQAGQADFVVHCTVTDPQGGSQQSLYMSSTQLHELMNGPLAPHIKNVSAMASEVLLAPESYSVRRITGLAADESISRLAGAAVTMLKGWEDSVFATTQPVCLVPAGTAVTTDDTGASYITVQDIGGTPTRLQVIGVVTGGPQNTLHIPMFLPLDGTNALPDIIVDSCGFDIADTSRLEESRAALYGSFCDPRDITTHSAGDYGLLINDEIFQTARAGVESSIALFRLLLPLLVAGMGLIGFLATALAAAGRRREFAVMRCMGIRRRTIAALVLEELLLCALAGTALALAAALALPGAFTLAMWLATGAVLLVFVLGGVAAALRITAVDVIKLMKVEE